MLKVKWKQCHCISPYWHVDVAQVGTCLKCGGVKIFPSNRELDEIIAQRHSKHYVPSFGIPKEVLEEIEREILRKM